MLEPGDGLVLPSHVVYHDGSTLGMGASEIAVLFEPKDQHWEGDVLGVHSLFR